jgi:S-DNA-T family DNA segregation ATPase FtsK/SpoIIIE
MSGPRSCPSAMPLVGRCRRGAASGHVGLFERSNLWGRRKPWRKAFDKLFVQRYRLLKASARTANRLILRDAASACEEMRQLFKKHARLAFDAFICCSGWRRGDCSGHRPARMGGRRRLLGIFDKPKEKQLGLADATIRFFDHDCDQENALDADGVSSWRI